MTSASCMLRHIAFIISVIDRFCDCCTYQNNYFQDHWKPSFWSSTPSTTQIAQSHDVCQKSGRINFFVMFTETTMKYALCCCSMLCFAWYFVFRKSLGKWLHTAPFWLGSSLASLKHLDSVVAAVLYATVPLGILCAVPFLGGRGYS